MKNLTSKHNKHTAQTHRDIVNDYQRSEEWEIIHDQLWELVLEDDWLDYLYSKPLSVTKDK